MKKIILLFIIIILFCCGMILGKQITKKDNTMSEIIPDSYETEVVLEKYNIQGEYEPNYDEIWPGYVGTAFKFDFNNGKVKYYTDGEFEGTYTIEDNIINIVFTISYNPATGEPEKPEYLKGGRLTIIDDNTLQNEEGLNFYKKD